MASPWFDLVEDIEGDLVGDLMGDLMGDRYAGEGDSNDGRWITYKSTRKVLVLKLSYASS